MAIVLVLNPGSKPEHYVRNATPNGAGVEFSENPADALVFADATAANNFSAGKALNGAVQVTVTGKKHYGLKSCNQ